MIFPVVPVTEPALTAVLTSCFLVCADFDSSRHVHCSLLPSVMRQPPRHAMDEADVSTLLV